MRYLDVSGSFPVAQSGAPRLVFDLHQVGTDVTGSASWTKPPGDGSGGLNRAVVSMEVRGTVTDRELTLTIAWNDGTRGVYKGVVHSDGTMSGTTHDSMHPQLGSTSWAVLSRTFHLAPAPATTRTAPIKAMGRRRPKPPASRIDASGTLTDLSRLEVKRSPPERG